MVSSTLKNNFNNDIIREIQYLTDFINVNSIDYTFFQSDLLDFKKAIFNIKTDNNYKEYIYLTSTSKKNIIELPSFEFLNILDRGLLDIDLFEEIINAFYEYIFINNCFSYNISDMIYSCYSESIEYSHNEINAIRQFIESDYFCLLCDNYYSDCKVYITAYNMFNEKIKPYGIINVDLFDFNLIFDLNNLLEGVLNE